MALAQLCWIGMGVNFCFCFLFCFFRAFCRFLVHVGLRVKVRCFVLEDGKGKKWDGFFFETFDLIRLQVEAFPGPFCFSSAVKRNISSSTLCDDTVSQVRLRILRQFVLTPR